MWRAPLARDASAKAKEKKNKETIFEAQRTRARRKGTHAANRDAQPEAFCSVRVDEIVGQTLRVFHSCQAKQASPSSLRGRHASRVSTCHSQAAAGRGLPDLPELAAPGAAGSSVRLPSYLTRRAGGRRRLAAQAQARAQAMARVTSRSVFAMPWHALTPMANCEIPADSPKSCERRDDWAAAARG